MISAAPALVLFDAAGTLIHPREPVREIYWDHFARGGWNVTAEDIGTAFASSFSALPDPAYELHETGDLAERAWWREVVKSTAHRAGIDVTEEALTPVFESLFEYYSNGSAWLAYPEVERVVSGLKKAGCKLAVVSNFDRRLHRILGELRLAPYFDLILTSADARARKPSPSIILQAMAAFPGSRACLVGDSPLADGGAAAAAGIPIYIVERPATTLVDFLAWFQSGDF